MKQREYRVGPGAVSLLLIIVVVSMSVLGLLSLLSARGDYRLTQRARDFAVAERAASVEAQRNVAELDALLAKVTKISYNEDDYVTFVCSALPEGMTMDGRVVRWQETMSGGRVLQCAVELLPLGSSERYIWREHAFEAVEYDDYDRLNFDMWE